MIHQGEQYEIAVYLHNGETVYTPDNVNGVKVKIGEDEKSYPGDLTYNSTTQRWIYPMTEDESLKYRSTTYCEAEIKVGEYLYKSNTTKIDVATSIIRGEW